jgi:hypothetical protein
LPCGAAAAAPVGAFRNKREKNDIELKTSTEIASSLPFYLSTAALTPRKAPGHGHLRHHGIGDCDGAAITAATMTRSLACLTLVKCPR